MEQAFKVLEQEANNILIHLIAAVVIKTKKNSTKLEVWKNIRSLFISGSLLRTLIIHRYR